MTHTKKYCQGKIFVWIEFRQAHNYVLFNYDELRPFIQYVYCLNFVIHELFLSCNITNSYIVEYLIDNIVNIYYLKTHNWPNPKSFNYKMNNFPCGLKHM